MSGHEPTAYQPEMIRRRDAAQATLNKFQGKPFAMGQRDCVRMAAHHLRLLGWKVKLPAAGSYRSVRSAMKALESRGHADLPAALDALGLQRKAPAGAIVGDIVWSPSEDPIGAIGIALGNGRICGFHEDTIGAEVLQPFDAPAIAWDGAPRETRW